MPQAYDYCGSGVDLEILKFPVRLRHLLTYTIKHQGSEQHAFLSENGLRPLPTSYSQLDTP